MEIGIGLPNAVGGTTGEQLVEWAKRAEARGFSSLGTIDRIAYDNWEPLTALTAAATVTERIGLTTAVMLGPLRGNPHALAKQTTSIQALSGGRLTLGIGVGQREDDFELAEGAMADRAELQDKLLTTLREDWADERIGPPVSAPPRILAGGAVSASFERAARFGDGWIAGGAGPEEFAEGREATRAAWSAAGREGEPFTACLAYYSLGDRAEENARDYLTHYYAFLGDELANYIAGSAAKDAESIQGAIAAYGDAGCDELLFFPSSGDPDQVDMLADAAGL
jgi:alkanesulfonate monooxygenase SsuD/methylene tetrahydromethanopterin reductase-like flavin-dependent oxidoreductase (luciferase family)